MTRTLLLLTLTLLAVSAHARTYLCGSEGEIQAALSDINAKGKGGTIGILPGTYNLKSPYRNDVEANGDDATIPAGGDKASLFAIYVSSPNVTIYAVVPGSVKLCGEKDAALNANATGGWSAFRGGMIYIEETAANATISGLDLDGMVPLSPTFQVNKRSDISNRGIDCWDMSHKAIDSRAPSARILDCKIHNWAGEMVFGGSQSSPVRKLEIRGCEIYGNQVSALSGTWQLRCCDNEFYDLHGQVMEGLHAFTCQYYDNYFHDCTGGGLNILGPVTKLTPQHGWWVDIRRNVFERMNSQVFGAIYLSKQTTPDVSPPSNVAIVDNTFRDCATVLSVSLGPAEQVYFADNLVALDSSAKCEGIVSKSGSFNHSLFKGNTFMLTQRAIDSGGILVSGNLSIGDHIGTRWVGNDYHNCNPPTDTRPGEGALATRLCFRDETYTGLHAPSLPQKSSAADPEDVPIPTANNGAPISTGVYALKFNTPMNLRMLTEDDAGNPLFVDGTELRLIGNDSAAPWSTAYLIHGRGCQLTDSEPAFLAAHGDYLLLRYDARLKLWVEVARSTPRANQILKLSHRGPAADLPLFDRVRQTMVDGVNVIDAALHGWRYYATDTGDQWIYTATGWTTTN